ncbi:MAG: ABC transporter permease [Bacteroidota bacterium]
MDKIEDYMRKNQLFQLILIRYKEFTREPGIIFWSIIFPIMMAWVLGVAFSRRDMLVKTVALVDPEPSMVYSPLEKLLAGGDDQITSTGDSAKIIRLSLNGLPDTRFRFINVSWKQSQEMIKQGKTQIIIEDLNDSVSFHFDPNSPDAQLNYLLLSDIIYNRQVIRENTSIKKLTRRGTRYIDFLIPGLIALGIMNSIIWGISYGLIDMRVKKLLRRMIATPMRKADFLLSHFFARLSLTIVETGILYTFAKLFFDIEIEGSILALILIFLAGNIAFTGISILLSSRTANSRVGTGLINVIILPMTVLSGIFFSYHNFPDEIIPFIQALPLTMLADGIRAVFIENAGIPDVALESILLFAIGGICFTIGLKIYKWY